MTRKLLARRDPPTAIVASSDFLAAAAMHAVRERGLRVPQDVAVTGFDDFPLSAYVAPALTTVAVPAYDMGRTAAEMLIDELEGRDPLVRQATFSVELRVRESA
jgi:DNA-binding LacI/PurR family transcriptional regulator